MLGDFGRVGSHTLQATPVAMPMNPLKPRFFRMGQLRSTRESTFDVGWAFCFLLMPRSADAGRVYRCKVHEAIKIRRMAILPSDSASANYTQQQAASLGICHREGSKQRVCLLLGMDNLCASPTLVISRVIPGDP